MRTLPYLSSREPALSASKGAKRRGDLLALLVLLLLSFAAPAASGQTTVCPGLKGWQALACIRDGFTPATVLDYDTARDSLFSHVWADRASSWAGLTIEGIYGGQRSGFSTYQRSARDVRLDAQDWGYNTEHVWPQSRGADQGRAHDDLHHLAPAWAEFNSARSNRPFGSGFDQWPDTYKWHKGRTTRYASASTSPPKEPALYSRVEKDFLSAPDNGDNWTSLDEMGRFDVRHVRRGDVARMAAYFLAIYQIEAEDGQEGRAFIERTLDVLLDWHETDVVDQDEQTRNDRIATIQGNSNPFTLDPTLLRRALYQGDRERPRIAPVWINEIHYANDGQDTGEGVEIAGPAGVRSLRLPALVLLPIRPHLRRRPRPRRYRRAGAPALARFHSIRHARKRTPRSALDQRREDARRLQWAGLDRSQRSRRAVRQLRRLPLQRIGRSRL